MNRLERYIELMIRCHLPEDCFEYLSVTVDEGRQHCDIRYLPTSPIVEEALIDAAKMVMGHRSTVTVRMINRIVRTHDSPGLPIRRHVDPQCDQGITQEQRNHIKYLIHHMKILQRTSVYMPTLTTVIIRDWTEDADHRPNEVRIYLDGPRQSDEILLRALEVARWVLPGEITIGAKWLYSVPPSP
jgi:hypothetical protein